MAEYVGIVSQTVAPNAAIVFSDSISCNSGAIYHRNESGIFILRGIVNNPCSNYARYQVIYNGNIAVPTDETPGPISVSIAIDGEALPSTTAIVTPTVVSAFFNVSSTTYIDVPRNCCLNISVENSSTIPIDIQNSNLTIVRTA